MKSRTFIILVALVFFAEIIALIVFAVQSPKTAQDTVAINEVVQTVQADWPNLGNHKNETDLDYAVLDLQGNVIFKTRDGLSESIVSAIGHGDAILDIVVNGEVVGKIIIFNDSASAIQSHKRTAVIILSVAIVIEAGICAAYGVYLHLCVVKPFRKLKGFAERVAGGNLEVPLEMDRGNMFGAFTESFDIMRSELKKARIAEAQANASKKELVAKLSHDIKTPVASIKAVAEVGQATAESQKSRESYNQIIRKADQINTLVTNLFTATLEELHQLSVSTSDLTSGELKIMLENSDYLSRATIPEIPDCLVRADKLRLQQVFDNIFANSYKYANTQIDVGISRGDGFLLISIEDFGGGVPQEEIAVLKEKFRRGSNSQNLEGAGLGLYISDYFMKEMGGELLIGNGSHGLAVTAAIRLSGTDLRKN